MDRKEEDQGISKEMRMLTSSELRQNEWNKEGRDKKKVNILYLDTNGLKRERAGWKEIRDVKLITSNQRRKLESRFKRRAKSESVQRGTPTSWCPIQATSPVQPLSPCEWVCDQEKHQIWYKQGYCGSVVTDRVSLHYTVIVTSVLP